LTKKLISPQKEQFALHG